MGPVQPEMGVQAGCHHQQKQQTQNPTTYPGNKQAWIWFRLLVGHILYLYCKHPEETISSLLGHVQWCVHT
jgi:hypothetical protein